MTRHKKQFMLIIPLVIVLTLTFGLTREVQAVEFDDDGVVESDEVIDDDLFIGGDNIEINGTVNGDLFAAGNTVIINGTVRGSLVTGAQSVILNGSVEGSFYAGSSTLTLGEEARVGRNLYYGGFNLTAEKGSMVERDLLVGAYQALLSGEVGRDVQVGAGAFELNGVVGGDVLAEIDAPDNEIRPFPFYGPPGVETIVPSGIRIAEGAQIGGKLIYSSPAEQSETIQALPEEGVDFTLIEINTDEMEESARKVGAAAMIGRFFLKLFRELITLLLLGGLALWQLPDLFRKVTDTVQAKALPSTGWGLVVTIVVYVGAFLAAGILIALGIFFGVITLGGLSRSIFGVGFSSLALVMAIFSLLFSYGSKLVVSMAVGNVIFKKIAPKYAEQKAWPLVTGIFLYVLLRSLLSIVSIGWLVSIPVILTGLGAMWLYYRDGRKPQTGEVQA